MKNAIHRVVSGGKGFTLIELLAVMAIVAVLAGIVSMAVSGTGQTSRDTQVKEDASTAGSAVAAYSGDQPITELFDNKNVDLSHVTLTDIDQKTSNQWPESLTSEVYSKVFQVTGVDGTPLGSQPTKTVNAIAFLDKSGQGQVATDNNVPATVTADATYATWTATQGGISISMSSTGDFDTLTIDATVYTFELDGGNKEIDVSTGGQLALNVTDGTGVSGGVGVLVGTARVFTAKDLMERFNAVDWSILETGGYSTAVPASLTDTTLDADFPVYLWVLEKGIAPTATGNVGARDVAVYGLISATPVSGSDPAEFDLTFQRLV